MKLTDHLTKTAIFLDADLADKTAVLKYIVRVCEQNRVIETPELLYQGLVEREQTMSTGVGKGIGFPHTANPEVRDTFVVLLRLAAPIPFDALDNQPVDLILGMIFPASAPGVHVRMLARVSRLCQNPGFLDAIRHADSVAGLLEQIRTMENNNTQLT